MIENILLVAKVGTPTVTGMQTTVGRDQVVTTSKSVTRGKWYWEVSLDSMSSSYPYAWIGVTSSTTTSNSTNHLMFYVNNYTAQRVLIYKNATTIETIPVFIAQGSIIGIVMDADNKTVQFFYGKDKYTKRYDISHLTDYTPAVLNVGANVSNNYTFNFGDSNFSLLNDISENISSEYKDKVLPYNGGKQINSLNKLLFLKNDDKAVAINQKEVSEKTIVPEMTSNTVPSGIASASSIYNATYNAWKGFSTSGSGYEGCWESLNKNMPQWLAYQFPTSKVISKYSVQGVDISATGANRNPKDWTFEGSNDGANWTVLDTQTNQINWNQNEKREFLIENVNSYLHYRIFITANNGGDYTLINVLHLHELINKANINQLPFHSEQNLINYGASSPVRLDGVFTDKHYTLQDVVSESSEGLWTTQVNKKPLTIKFK